MKPLLISAFILSMDAGLMASYIYLNRFYTIGLVEYLYLKFYIKNNSYNKLQILLLNLSPGGLLPDQVNN